MTIPVIPPYPRGVNDLNDDRVRMWFRILRDNYTTLNEGLLTSDDFTSNGILVRTVADTFTSRSISGTGGISVTNGDGVSGNPTITLDASVTFPGNVTANSFTLPIGSSATTGKTGATVISTVTDANNSGVAETDLYSTTIAASSLTTNGQFLDLTTCGSFTSAAGNKRVRLYVNGTVVYDTGSLAIGGTAGVWFIRCTVGCSSSGTNARCAASAIHSISTVADSTTFTDVATTWSAPVIIKVTGLGTAGSVVVGRTWQIKWYDN